MENYSNHLRKLFARIQLYEKDKVAEFLNGLLPSLKRAVRMFEPNNLSEAIKRARTAEEMAKEERRSLKAHLLECVSAVDSLRQEPTEEADYPPENYEESNQQPPNRWEYLAAGRGRGQARQDWEQWRGSPRFRGRGRGHGRAYMPDRRERPTPGLNANSTNRGRSMGDSLYSNNYHNKYVVQKRK